MVDNYEVDLISLSNYNQNFDIPRDDQSRSKSNLEEESKDFSNHFSNEDRESSSKLYFTHHRGSSKIGLN